MQTDRPAPATGVLRPSVEIPVGHEGWHPNEVTQWPSDVEDDESVSDADVYRARATVDYALGIEPSRVMRHGRAPALTEGVCAITRGGRNR